MTWLGSFIRHVKQQWVWDDDYDPSQPAQPAYPVQSVQPAQPANPVQSVQPAQPANPVQHGHHWAWDDDYDPSQPAQPAHLVQCENQSSSHPHQIHLNSSPQPQSHSPPRDEEDEDIFLQAYSPPQPPQQLPQVPQLQPQQQPPQVPQPPAPRPQLQPLQLLKRESLTKNYHDFRRQTRDSSLNRDATRIIWRELKNHPHDAKFWDMCMGIKDIHQRQEFIFYFFNRVASHAPPSMLDISRHDRSVKCPYKPKQSGKKIIKQ